MIPAVLNKSVIIEQQSQSLYLEAGENVSIIRWEGTYVVVQGMTQVVPCNGRKPPIRQMMYVIIPFDLLDSVKRPSIIDV